MAAPSLAEFQSQADDFLASHCERRVEERVTRWGEGSDRVGMFEERTKAEESRVVARAKEWRNTVFDAGFGWITGPEQYGGRNLTPEYQRAYNEVAAQYATPNEGPFVIGLGMVAPTILAHGIEEVKQRYLKALWRGDIIGCQLFSEPVAGSDLAGIQTRAERDGDEWIVTGQKVWTSGAQFSDIGEIITRTSPDKPKHKGMTMFVIDMHAPGVDVRPLRQMTGGASFNEVFLNEVRIPDTHRLGDVDEGWGVALTTLMNERMAIGAGGGGGGAARDGQFTRFVQMAQHFGVANDPVVRQRLAGYYMHAQAARLSNLRAVSKIKAGQTPGPELSIAKLASTNNMQRAAALVGELLGPRLVADNGEWGTYAWAEMVLGVPGGRIAGGSDEVMHNILGERVLGLPKEPGHQR